MSPEVTSAVIGAVVGSATTYLFGWRLKAFDEKRRRKSIATAILWETYPLTNAFDTLRGSWPGYRVGLEFPTTAIDAFPRSAELFQSSTVVAVLDLLGSIRDVKVGLATLEAPEAHDPEGIKQAVRQISATCLGKIIIVRDAAMKEGGTLQGLAAWPPQDRINKLVAETGGRLAERKRLTK